MLLVSPIALRSSPFRLTPSCSIAPLRTRVPRAIPHLGAGSSRCRRPHQSSSTGREPIGRRRPPRAVVAGGSDQLEVAVCHAHSCCCLGSLAGRIRYGCISQDHPKRTRFQLRLSEHQGCSMASDPTSRIF